MRGKIGGQNDALGKSRPWVLWLVCTRENADFGLIAPIYCAARWHPCARPASAYWLLISAGSFGFPSARLTRRHQSESLTFGRSEGAGAFDAVWSIPRMAFSAYSGSPVAQPLKSSATMGAHRARDRALFWESVCVIKPPPNRANRQRSKPSRREMSCPRKVEKGAPAVEAMRLGQIA